MVMMNKVRFGNLKTRLILGKDGTLENSGAQQESQVLCTPSFSSSLHV